MADATDQRVWNTAARQIHITRPNYATWLKDTEGLRVEPGIFVVGVRTEVVKDRPAIWWTNSDLSFYGAEESEQDGANFPTLPGTRPLDRSGFQCYGFRHPLARRPVGLRGLHSRFEGTRDVQPT